MAVRNEVRDFSKVAEVLRKLSFAMKVNSKEKERKELLEKLEGNTSGYHKLLSVAKNANGQFELRHYFNQLSEGESEMSADIIKNVLVYDIENAKVYLRVISDFLNEEGEKKRKGDLSLALTLNKLAGDTKTASKAIDEIVSNFALGAVQNAVKLYEGTKTETLSQEKELLLEKLSAKSRALQKLKTAVELKQGKEAAELVKQTILSVEAIKALVTSGIAHDADIKELLDLNTPVTDTKDPEEHVQKRRVHKAVLDIKTVMAGAKAIVGEMIKWICRPFRSLLKTNESSAYLKERTTLLSVHTPTANQLNTLKTNTGSSVNTTISETPSKESLKSFIQTLNNSSERATLKTLEENDINRKSKEPNSRATLRKSSFLKERSLSLKTDETRTTLAQKTLR